MAIRSVAVPLLSGGALLLGYAAFAWLRPKPRALPRLSEPREDLEPLSDRLEHVPEESALDLSHDPPLDEHASVHPSDLGALFLARATESLDPFHWPDRR
jgi:hypothetical protein